MYAELWIVYQGFLLVDLLNMMVLRHSVSQNLQSLPSSRLALYMKLKGMIAGNCEVQILFS